MSSKIVSQPKSRGARAVPPPENEAAIVTLSRCVLELLDYVSKHSDDTAELTDSIKWQLEAIIRRTAS